MAGERVSQKFCYKCGAEIHAGSTYCRVCGYRKDENHGDTREKAR